VILFLTNADTEILALRTVLEGLPPEFPGVRAANPSGSVVLGSARVVLVRLLGGRRAWEDGFDRLRADCVAAGVPLLAFGGESVPDAELAALSTAPTAQAFEYLRAGGLHNMEHLLRFVADTVLLAGFGFDPPVEVPAFGVWRGPAAAAPAAPAAPAPAAPAPAAVLNTSASPGPPSGPNSTPTPPGPPASASGGPPGGPPGVAVTPPQYAETQGGGSGAPSWSATSARPGAGGTPGSRPRIGVVFYRAHVLSGNTQFVDDLCDAIEAKGADALAVYCYSLREPGPLDLLKQADLDCLVTTVLAMGSAHGDQWDASGLAALDIPIVQAIAATQPAEQWQDSDNGLTPIDVAMAVAIPEFDGRIVTVPFSFKETVDDGDALGSPVTAYRTVADRTERVAGIAAGLARLAHTPNQDKRVAIILSAYPTKQSRLGNAVALDTPASTIHLLRALQKAGYQVENIPPDGDALMHALADHMSPEHPTALDLGNVLVAIQPPRGFGDNPIAVYHSPDLPPVAQYVDFYRWLEHGWGAHAVIHAGKHGTLEWLPGKGVGLSAECWPDRTLGDLPLIYPFVVNDPGEGTQAKRRAHAVIVDHLLPPMTRADAYDDIAKLEGLLDEYAQVAALDPAKLPAIRAQVWDLLVEAELHRDLGLDGKDAPGEDEFDDLVLHVDGYLCELKDAQIRGGLHTLGQPPEGEALIDLVLAMTRLPQGDVPPLRRPTDGSTKDTDAAEAEARAKLEAVAQAQWRHDGIDPTLTWVCDTLVPNLRRATDEIGSILHALDGGHVPSGPSGAPTRGMAHVLPTGRNFYSVDPKALPSRLAWDVGQKLADQLLQKHLEEEGRYPESVGLVVWGTAAMRTSGDDVAEALALLGVRPVWAAESQRVTGVELIPDAELNRPRVDVTLRISGFFRDAFPHLIALLDDAFRLAGFDDDPRIFGAKPGAYGSGILPLLESRDWRSDDDLAAVYEAWSGFAYDQANLGGTPALDAMRRRFSLIDVAVKNQDNREHDIFDSDDYMQDHGGMVATIRALTGRQPKAWFGDSANPAAPKVRTLQEEAARVVRTRVVNPKWIDAMQRHGYKGAFEMAATVDYLFGYDATAHVVEDWMYERVTESYVADPAVRKFFEQSNPWALRSISERLLEAHERGLWDASDTALATLRSALLEAEGWEESR
jgi:cobaltochelatase CobN